MFLNRFRKIQKNEKVADIVEKTNKIGAPNISSTQEHLPIEHVKNSMVVLKDGGMVVILRTSAVNFGLLSENEQLAIISSFAGFLNSLSFAIQIVIRSRRLDVTNYLKRLEKAYQQQKNPLLAKMMERYKFFVEKTVKENNVLDKQFYIIIPVSNLELGFKKDVEGHMKKAITILIPRRDHIIRQLSRMGLKAEQLTTKDIIKLFYSIYNPIEDSKVPDEKPALIPPQQTPKVDVAKQQDSTGAPNSEQNITLNNQSVYNSEQSSKNPQEKYDDLSTKDQSYAVFTNRNYPLFQVEELEDEYTTA